MHWENSTTKIDEQEKFCHGIEDVEALDVDDNANQGISCSKQFMCVNILKFTLVVNTY